MVDKTISLVMTILKAIDATGQRAIISKGRAGLGEDELDARDNVLIVGNIPHDWLFWYVSCVIYHGGVGTTASGLARGLPTLIMPVFGDQQFWGNVVARAGAGPPPIPYKELTTGRLVESINLALKPHIRQSARRIREKMHNEFGVRDGVRSFHRHIDLQQM